MFRVSPPFELKKLEALFRHKVLRMLLNKGKIMQEFIAMLSSWRHSGFNVFCGNRISPNDDTAMENLARYIIRASFSQERMQYLDQEGTVVYTSKDGATTRNFPALETVRGAPPNPWRRRGTVWTPCSGSKTKTAPIAATAARGRVGAEVPAASSGSRAHRAGQRSRPLHCNCP
jgi:hypothetical protein